MIIVILDFSETCFGPKWPKTGHFGCRTSCVAGGRVGLPSAVSHVQAHSSGAAFLPNFNFSHFLAFCGQIQCFMRRQNEIDGRMTWTGSEK